MRISDWSSDVCSSDLRDLLGKVVETGHADWRVTLRCYIHMQWLLRSLQDAAIGEKYMHRRTVAFATGLTLPAVDKVVQRSEEHTSELQSLMRISYDVFCLKNKKQRNTSYVISSSKQIT